MAAARAAQKQAEHMGGENKAEIFEMLSGGSFSDLKKFKNCVLQSCSVCNQQVVGPRYTCKRCTTVMPHRMCEKCHAQFEKTQKLELPDPNPMKWSEKTEDHEFVFETGGPKVSQRQKPNDACACGSGKKYKKCCR